MISNNFVFELEDLQYKIAIQCSVLSFCLQELYEKTENEDSRNVISDLFNKSLEIDLIAKRLVDRGFDEMKRNRK